ncbi:unnamed protein product [Closterium sp. NIES-65]|nr:unnamed protein product [Closterium sp. NIES-65]
MASPTVLIFDAAVDFDVWVDDLQLCLWDHFLSLCPTELTVDMLEEPLTAAETSIVAVGASRNDPRAPFFEGVPPFPFSPLLLLLLLTTSLAPRWSALRLLLVGGAAAARARGARVVEGTAGAALVAVEEAEGVGVEVGVEAGVGALVASVAAVVVGAAAAAAVGVVAAVVLVGVDPCSVEALVVASASSSRVLVRPHPPSSFVSGTLGVGGLGVLVPALTFSTPASAVGRRAGCHTRRSAASVA